MLSIVYAHSKRHALHQGLRRELFWEQNIKIRVEKGEYVAGIEKAARRECRA